MKAQWQQVPRVPAWPRWAVATALAWLALAGATVAMNQVVHRFSSLCPFHLLTGLPCPACGLGRGCLAILAGHPLQAWLLNPLLFTILAVFLASLAARLALAHRLAVQLTARQRAIAWVLAAAVLGANWAYLIVHVR